MTNENDKLISVVLEVLIYFLLLYFVWQTSHWSVALLLTYHSTRSVVRSMFMG
jgi:hypothetical protein